MRTKNLSTYFYVTPILNVKFGECLCRGIGDNEDPKFLGKCSITAPPKEQLAVKYN